MTERAPSPQPRVRLDVWLWRARLARTRGLCSKMVRSGHVRVNGAREKAPGRGVVVGDVLTVALERNVRVMRVASFGERRGPSEEARGLYVDLSPEPPTDSGA